MSQSFPISKVASILIFSFQFITYLQFVEAKTIQREVKTELITEGESVIRAKSFIVSPNYKKVACVIDLPKIHIVVNGERQKNYEDVKNLVFSPDSNKLAYAVREGNRWFVVINGEEQKSEFGYEDISGIVFSPDSQRLAYVARQYGYSFVVIDGKEERKNYKIGISTPIFSPDSKRIVYIAKRINPINNSFSRNFVIVDGEEMQEYDIVDNVIFSPDSKKFAYYTKNIFFVDIDTSVQVNRCSVIINNKAGDKFDQIEPKSLVFSPNSQKLAYKGKQNGKWFFVVTDSEGQDISAGYYDIKISTNLFSPDSKRFAYVGESKKLLWGEYKDEWLFIIGQDKSIQTYSGFDDIQLGNTSFSPDSEKFIFAAKRGNKWFIVVNGQESKQQYNEIKESSIIFSPDSKRLAYVAGAYTLLDRWFVVIEEKECKKCEDIRMESLVFSPDSRRLAYVVSILDKFFVILDETEGERFEKIIDNKIIFDTANKFYYLTEDSWRNIYLVRETIVIQE